MTQDDATPATRQGGRILVDHTHCGRHVTGLERITLELFSQAALEPLAVEIVGSTGVRDMIYRQTVWMPLQLLRDRNALLLCPGFPPSIPAGLFGGRVLPYVHDVFLLNRPQDLNPRARLYMAPAFRRAVTRLPRFLVNSETTRDELMAYARPDAQITLYRPAVRNVFGLTQEGRVERDTAATPRLVALGTIEPRKNLLAAARILGALRLRGFPEASLDLVGRSGWGDDERALSATPGVTLHGYQPVERVREIVAQADALICTSHDEGLGLPLLEAQYAGLPVIAPDRPVFREVLRESGTFIDPDRPDEAAMRIAALFGAPDWRCAAVAAAARNLDRWLHLAAMDHGQVIELIARLSRQRTDPMLIKQTILYLPAQIAGPLFQFLAAIVWTFWLKPDAYGVLAYVMAMQELAFVICLAWWSHYTLRYSGTFADAAEVARFQQVETATLIVSSLLQVVVCVVTLSLQGIPLTVAMLGATMLYVITRSITNHLGERARAAGQIGIYTAGQTIGPVFGFCIAFLLVSRIAPTPEHALLGFAVAHVVGLAWMWQAHAPAFHHRAARHRHPAPRAPLRRSPRRCRRHRLDQHERYPQHRPVRRRP